MTLFPVYDLHYEPLVATVVLGVLAVVVASRWGSSMLASLRRAAGGPARRPDPKGRRPMDEGAISRSVWRWGQRSGTRSVKPWGILMRPCSPLVSTFSGRQ